MSHGGPLTLAQKRMMAMRTTTDEPHNTPLLPAVYSHSSSASTTDEQFGDIEMQDISAPASTASPPANYNITQNTTLLYYLSNGIADHTLGALSLLPYIKMGLEPQTKTEAANAITVLRSSFHSSAEAVSKLEQYIHHLEELLLEELGREEFERRLEHLILRDQRNEESLFIPNENPICRKRGSSSTEVGSSPKKARSDSLVSSLSGASGLGRSILEGGRRLHSDSPEVSPKTSRKTSVLEVPPMDAQQKPTTVKQMARRPIIAPRSRTSRGSQSAMLPNKQPSSNFHSGSQSAVLPNIHPSSNLDGGLNSPLEIKSSVTAAPPSATHISSTSSRRDSVQSETASKQSRSDSVSSSSIRNNPPLPGPNSSQSVSKPITMTHALPNKPVFASAHASTSSSSTQRPSSLSNKTPSLSSDQPLPLSSSSKLLSLTNKSASGSSRPAPSSEQQPLSLTRKPWRASKK
ncbi:hypothetical protein KCU64_g6937, partial [Aureobasidium melanogenum]